MLTQRTRHQLELGRAQSGVERPEQVSSLTSLPDSRQRERSSAFRDRDSTMKITEPKTPFVSLARPLAPACSCSASGPQVRYNPETDEVMNMDSESPSSSNDDPHTDTELFRRHSRLQSRSIDIERI